MKCKKTEHGIELIPENDFDAECLRHLERQTNVSIKFEDTWNKSGNLHLEGKGHPWDER